MAGRVGDRMYDAVRVFSATKASDRHRLGDVVTHWLQQHKRAYEVADALVKQSSDREFHCLTIVIFLLHR